MSEADQDLRFSDPLIGEILESWRIRQGVVEAQRKLTLQIKAICRRYVWGDKAEAERLYSAMMSEKEHEAKDSCLLACSGLIAARVPLEEQRKAFEKVLSKLGKQTPLAHVVNDIKGINYNTLATIIGECGDLSAYPTIAGVWKRAGLAVIEGERQRRVKDADKALLHGYSPMRRSVFWNIGAALLKSQGTGENAGPYRKIYDQRKEIELAKGLTKGHAHNRAMRYMTKELLKDLTLEWRRVKRDAAGTSISETPNEVQSLPRPDTLLTTCG